MRADPPGPQVYLPGRRLRIVDLDVFDFYRYIPAVMYSTGCGLCSTDSWFLPSATLQHGISLHLCVRKRLWQHNVKPPDYS